MEYTLNENGETIDLVFQGKFSFSDSELVKGIISEVKKSDCKNCSIDATALTAIDSAGLGMLLLVNDALKENDKDMVLHGAAGQVLKMLEISKFSEIITIKA